MNNISTFKACFNAGDLIATIPAMRQHYKITGNKIILYCWLNRPMEYPDGNWHPVQHEGINVAMNEKMFEFIRPLFLAQDFIEDVKIWQGEKIKVDFDRLKESFQIMPYGSLNRYIFYLFPDLSCDLSKIYIETEGIDFGIDKILISRTSRYHNHLLNYFFLKEYEAEVFFIGLRKEHEEFCKEFNLNIKHIYSEDAHHMAKLILGSKFFISNQTMSFQIAEGLKVPRILERCPAIPNVIPIGEDAYDCHYQLDLEYHFKTLYNKTKQA